MTIDILASREDGEDLLAETKFIMVARCGLLPHVCLFLLYKTAHAVTVLIKMYLIFYILADFLSFLVGALQIRC